MTKTPELGALIVVLAATAFLVFFPLETNGIFGASSLS